MRAGARLLVCVLLCACLPSLARGDDGRALFEPCRACHMLEHAAPPGAGPNLAGLIGRRLAGDPGFDYSPALRDAAANGDTWAREKLDRFLADPEEMFPGMWMTMRPMRDANERKALIDFLADPTSR